LRRIYNQWMKVSHETGGVDDKVRSRTVFTLLV